MHLQGKPVCSFDPEGLIFAAGVNSEMVKLYDLRSFDKVNFWIFKLSWYCGSFDGWDKHLRTFCIIEEVCGRYWKVSYSSSSFYLLQGPFATFKMQYDRTCEWTGLKFSNDGKLILISTNGSFIRLIDAFKGVVMHTFGVSWQSLSMAISLFMPPGLRIVLAG